MTSYVMNVEADEIAYRAAFACQKQGYRLHPAHGDAVDYGNEFTKTQIVAEELKNDSVLGEHYTLEPYPIIEEEHIVNYTVDRMVEELFNIPDLHVSDVSLFLSPSDHSNFRYALANTPGPCGVGYKAGRGAKPYWLSHIRQRLVTEWGGVECHGYEADDFLGIYQTKDTVACHIDKDINMISGMHYNHVTKAVYEVPEGLGYLTYENKKLRGYGTIFFYAQLLIGDRTDNINGIKGIGDKGAFELLGECKHEDTTHAIVAGEYIEQHGRQALERVKENADLLWICRKHGETGSQYLTNRGFIE